MVRLADAVNKASLTAGISKESSTPRSSDHTKKRMPSNLKKNKYFREIFDWNLEGIKEQFEHLSGVIVIDSLDNLDELESDITEFCDNTGLQVKETKTVGLDGLKAVIDEATKKLQNKKQP